MPQTVDPHALLKQDSELMLKTAQRKLEDGKTLTKAERDALRKLTDQEELDLGQSPTRTRTIKEYAAAYSYKERQIKNWIKMGKDSEDPPPLDDPAAMRPWYDRHHQRGIPTKLEEAICQLVATGEWSSPSNSEDSSDITPEKKEPRRVELAGNQGISELVKRLTHEEEELYALYRAAKEEGENTEALAFYKRWLSAAESLRKQSKESLELLIKEGKYVLRSDVAAEWVSLNRVVMKQVVASLKHRRQEIQQVDAAAFPHVIEEAVAHACSVLLSSRFAEPLELSDD